jgi:DNA-binding CsgD family transcriptional regulator
MSDEGFLDWCHRRARYGNKKSQDVRAAKAAEKADAIRAYKGEYPDVTLKELSNIFDISESTLKSLSLDMAETRKQARQTKAVSRAEEIRTYKQEHPELSNRAIAEVLGCALDTVNRACRK